MNGIRSRWEFSSQWTQYRPEVNHKALKQRKQIHWWATSPSTMVTAAENILLNACSRPLESYGCVAYLVTDAPNLSSVASRTSRKQEVSLHIYSHISTSKRICRSQWPLACWDCGFESHRGHGCLSVVTVLCCKVEISATNWSLVQRSPTDCGASLCVI